MTNSSDEILRTFLENVLRVQQERESGTLSDAELQQVALEAGMTDADLAYIRQRTDDYLNRGNGFLRYRNWDDAVRELEQAGALAPNNIQALNALATAYAGRWQNGGEKEDAERALKTAERVLQIDSGNDTAIRIISGLRTKRRDILANAVGGNPASGGRRLILIGGLVVAASILLTAFLLLRKGTPEPVIAKSSPPVAAPLAQPAPRPSPRPHSDTAAAAGIASVALTFGREGTGPGLLTDARSIAIDGAGQVYVAGYSDGRIQVFDSAGNYLRQWSIGSHKYVKGLAADRTGTVYAVFDGRIHRYDGTTGELLGEVKYAGGPGFVSVATMADGGLIAGWDGLWRGGLFVNPESNENAVIFDRTMRAIRTIKHPISSITENVVFDPRVAADGLGNIYMVDESGSAVYRFTPQGKYVDKFGTAPDGSGMTHRAGEIAVDGRGRVFVTDFSGIRAFDGEGRYLGSIDVRGSSDAIAFNGRDELYALGRTKVTKFTTPR